MSGLYKIGFTCQANIGGSPQIEMRSPICWWNCDSSVKVIIIDKNSTEHVTIEVKYIEISRGKSHKFMNQSLWNCTTAFDLFVVKRNLDYRKDVL